MFSSKFKEFNQSAWNLYKKTSSFEEVFQSGWQDSNLRPPRPKRGAITGLRYTPCCCLLAAERPGFEPGQHLRVDRLAICSITTLAPLLFIMNLCNKIADANVPFHWEERKQFI